jgi:hypothetical protein
MPKRDVAQLAIAPFINTGLEAGDQTYPMPGSRFNGFPHPSNADRADRRTP